MQWWNDFIDWFNSDEGWRVISGAVIPFVAIIVAGIIGGLIGRNSTRRLLTWQDRELQSAAVAAIIGVGDRASMWSSLPSGEKDHLDAQMIAADIRLRLLPITGSSAAADWASHELALMQRNSADFSFQAQQSFVDYRDRLLEWQRRPGRARKLFAADLERFRFESNDAEAELVEKQRRWAVEQQAKATRDAPSDNSETTAVGTGAVAGAGTAVAIEQTALVSSVEPVSEPESASIAAAVEPEPAVSVVEPDSFDPAVAEPAAVEPVPGEPEHVEPEPAPSDTAQSDTAPSYTAPSDTAPSYTAPSDTAQFEATEFAAMQPQTIHTDTVQPETAQPETAETETSEPETSEPETVETAQLETAQPEIVAEQQPEQQFTAPQAPLHEEVVPHDEPSPSSEQPAALVEPVQLATAAEVAEEERKPFVYEPFVAMPFVTESMSNETPDAEPTSEEQPRPEEPAPAKTPPALILPAEPQQTVSLPTIPPSTFGRRVTRPAGSVIPTAPVDPNETQPYIGPYPTREDLS